MKQIILILLIVNTTHWAKGALDSAYVDSMRATIDSPSSQKEAIRSLAILGRYLSDKEPREAIQIGNVLLKKMNAGEIDKKYSYPSKMIALAYQSLGMMDSAYYYAVNAGSKVAKNPNVQWEKRCECYLFTMKLAQRTDRFSIAKQYLDSADSFCDTQQGNEAMKARIKWLAGFFYAGMGNLENALSNFLVAMRYYEEVKDFRTLAALKQNVALIYSELDEKKEAIKLLKEAEKLFDHRDLNTLTIIRYNICQNLIMIGDYEQAYTYSEKALSGAIKANNLGLKKLAYRAIGDLFLTCAQDSSKQDNSSKDVGIFSIDKQFMVDSSIYYYGKVFEIAEITKVSTDYSHAYMGLSKAYLQSNNIVEAVKFIDLAASYTIDGESGSLTIQLLPNQIEAYRLYSEELANSGAYKKAYEYSTNANAFMRKFKALNDSVVTEAKVKAMANELNKFELDIQEIRHEHKVQEQKLIEDAHKKRLRLIITGVSIGAVALVIFLLILYKRYKQSRLQNKIISSQKESLHVQHEQLEESSRQIKDSITYASRIQASLLPEQISEMFADAFIFFKPKDVVSGDFYWSYENEIYKYLVVADCTGHGVPGAFMSVLGISLLDKILIQMKLEKPHEILTQLSLDVSRKLQKEGDLMSSDSMDISLIRIAKSTNELSYCGVINDLIIRTGSGVKKLRSEILPIGFQKEGFTYKDQIVQLDKGDLVFMYTDGYTDQFSGDSGKKIGAAKFESLLSVSDISLEQLGITLAIEFDNLRGDRQQIDDVCVIGVKI